MKWPVILRIKRFAFRFDEDVVTNLPCAGGRCRGYRTADCPPYLAHNHRVLLFTRKQIQEVQQQFPYLFIGGKFVEYHDKWRTVNWSLFLKGE